MLIGVRMNYMFFYKKHFHKGHQTEIGKKLANAKQHPEAEHLLFESYSHYSKKISKLASVVVFMKFTINYKENENENKK